MKAYFGTFFNKLDGKGRVSVPAPYRAVLQARGLTSIAAHPAPFDPYIVAAGLDRFDGLGSQLTDSFLPRPGNEDAEYVMSELRELPLDGDGRIVLPDEFIAHAKLTDQVGFEGQTSFFRLWEPSALQDLKKARLARLAASLKGGES